VSPWGAQTVSARVVLAADGLGGTSLRGLSGFEPIYRRQSHMGLAATTGAGASPPAGTVCDRLSVPRSNVPHARSTVVSCTVCLTARRKVFLVKWLVAETVPVSH
jgi:hypothetical protein